LLELSCPLLGNSTTIPDDSDRANAAIAHGGDMNPGFRGSALGVVLSAGLLITTVDASYPSLPTVEVVASGLDNPRGLAIGPDHAVYVAEAGRGGSGKCLINGEGNNVCYGATGAITRISAFHSSRIVKRLPSLAPPPGAAGAGTGAAGVQDIVFDKRGQGIASIGLGADPNLRASLGAVGARFARLLRFRAWGGYEFDEDLGTFEASQNPAGGTVDSNPFGLVRWGSSVVVADAGGNDLLRVDDGAISVLATFPDRLVPFGPPGNMIPMQPVPTTVAEGPDGALYIGQLTGFPFPVGGANVYRLVPGGTPEVFATGFTNIIDIAFGRDRALYVLQISANGLLSGNPVGALIRVARDGTRTNIAAGALISPGGLAIARDGSIYVSRFATLPGAGDVVRIRP
jgi:hypothetical protein